MKCPEYSQITPPFVSLCKAWAPAVEKNRVAKTEMYTVIP